MTSNNPKQLWEKMEDAFDKTVEFGGGFYVFNLAAADMLRIIADELAVAGLKEPMSAHEWLLREARRAEMRTLLDTYSGMETPE